MLRDIDSYNILNNLNCNFSSEAIITADECFTFEPLSKRHKEIMPSVCFIPKFYSNANEKAAFMEILKELQILYKSSNIKINIIIIDIKADLNVKTTISNYFTSNNIPFTITECSEADKLIEHISGNTLLISMRLHGLIFSALSNVPYIAVSNEIKLNSFMKQSGLPELYFKLDNLNINLFENKINEIFTERNKYLNIIKSSVHLQKQKAYLNKTNFISILKKKYGDWK